MVKVCILASSSSGNAVFIAAGGVRILIDAGLSRREMFQRLAAIGEDPQSIDAVLITHEHCDHVCGLVRLLRKVPAQAYMSRLTAPGIDWGDFQPRLVTFQAGEQFSIGNVTIQSFTIPHDAADPCGFTLMAEGIKIGVVTDLGYIPASVEHHLRGSDLLIMESNHDLEMLKVGPYPWSVKQRVMGRNGHLSNDLVSDFILDGMDREVGTLVLGHLSEHNNHPEIVRITAAQALARCGASTHLVVAEPGRQSQVFSY